MQHIITLESKDLQKRLTDIEPFMSDEAVRFYLNGVLCEYKEGKLRLVATNGYILQRQILENAVEEGVADFQAICPAFAVRHLIKLLDAAAPLTKISLAEKAMQFNCVDFIYETKLIDGTFPDYEKVIPEGKITHGIGFDANYVLPILSTFGRHRPINMAVDQGEPGKSAEPHVLTSDAAKGMTCVIMPMRASW